MENIIRKSIEGNWKQWYGINKEPAFVVYCDRSIADTWWVRWDTFPAQPMEGQRIDIKHMVLDPKFWLALSRACKWDVQMVANPQPHNYRWFIEALKFYEINLTDGWQKAIEYLESVVK